MDATTKNELAASLLLAMVKGAIFDKDRQARPSDNCLESDNSPCGTDEHDPGSSAMQAIARHCDHCRGFAGAKCTCTFGCSPCERSMCEVVHDDTYCSVCALSKGAIRDIRYDCTVCPELFLCESCYEAGETIHDSTHAFVRIDRVGSVPVLLPPRKLPPSPSTAGSVNESSDDSSLEISPDDFQEGDEVELTGLKMADWNGAIAIVLPHDGDDEQTSYKVKVRLVSIEPRLVCSVLPERLTKLSDGVDRFSTGDEVELYGLDNWRWNGALGFVIGLVESDDTGKTRWKIRLKTKNEGTVCSIKSENLKRHFLPLPVFEKGDSIELIGLRKAEWNGAKGVIANEVPLPHGKSSSEARGERRWKICLETVEPNLQCSIKPENMMKRLF